MVIVIFLLLDLCRKKLFWNRNRMLKEEGKKGKKKLRNNSIFNILPERILFYHSIFSYSFNFETYIPWLFVTIWVYIFGKQQIIKFWDFIYILWIVNVIWCRRKKSKWFLLKQNKQKLNFGIFELSHKEARELIKSSKIKFNQVMKREKAERSKTTFFVFHSFFYDKISSFSKDFKTFLDTFHIYSHLFLTIPNDRIIVECLISSYVCLLVCFLSLFCYFLGQNEKGNKTKDENEGKTFSQGI